MAKIPVPTILNGFPGVVEQRPKYSWDPRTGFITTRTFIGPQRAITGLLASLQAGGWSFEVDPDGGQNYRVTAMIGASWSNSGLQDNPVDVWELTSNRVEKDLLSSNLPIINALTPAAGMTPSDLFVIRYLLDNPPQSPPVVGAPSASANPPQLSADGLLIYKLMTAGVTSSIVFQPVLRQTQTVSSQFAINQAVTGVGTLFSSATLSSIIPAGLLVSLPADGSYVNSNGFTMNFGWLKDFPNVTVAAYNKTQITQDWQFGFWEETLWGVPA